MLLALLVGCLACPPGPAQDTENAPPAVEATPAPSPAPRPLVDDLFGRFLPRVGYSYDGLDTVGRPIGGLSAFQAFVPLWQDPESVKLLFSDSRLLLFDARGTVGANLGLGGRLFSGSLGRTLGGYVYWDYSDTGRASFSQVSGGVETLGDLVDARANFYVPVGRDKKQIDQQFTPYAEPYFQQNALLVGGGQGTRTFEQALAGFDTEAGLKFFASDSLELRAFAGMYLFQGDVAALQAWGPRGRVEARVRDSLALGLSVQNDRLFGTTVNFNVLMTFPRLSGRAYSDGPPAPLAASDRLGDPVVRLQHVAVDRTQERFVVAGRPVIDPATGQPYFFLHVAPGGNSDGSFENPYATLTAAFADPRFARGNVVVYDRTQGTFVGNVTLAPGTRLLSSGPVQLLDSRDLGKVALPFSGTSPGLAQLPAIQGTVTLTGPGAVSGFLITGPGAGIAAAPGAVLRDVAITGNVLHTGGPGILLPATAGLIDVSGNRVSGAGGAAVLVGVGAGEQASVRVADNTIDSPGGDGVAVRAGGGSRVQATVSGNAVDGAVHDGILVTAEAGAQVRAGVSGNKVTNSAPAGDGAIAILATGAPGSATLIATLGGNNLRDNVGTGVTARSSGGNTLSLDLFNNTALSPLSLVGFLLQQQGKSTFNAVDPDTIGSRNLGTVTTTGTINAVASRP
jgi:hypothetical protein